MSISPAEFFSKDGRVYLCVGNPISSKAPNTLEQTVHALFAHIGMDVVVPVEIRLRRRLVALIVPYALAPRVGVRTDE